MNSLRRAFIGIMAIVVAAVLTACGGGGGGGTPAPSGLSYSTPPAYTVQVAITALTPTVTGTVTSYSVSPALPSGLSISSTTGVISGTPTTVTATATYTVTATNAGGSTAAQISITVNGVPPTMAYASSYYAYTANVPTSRNISPDSINGAITSWSISPTLPPGLQFDTSGGAITGTPTAGSPATAYTVTGTGPSGSATAQFSIEVQAAPFIDLGHASNLSLLRTSSTRIFSVDGAGHWLLQDYAAGTTLASGDGASCSTSPIPTCTNADMVGNIVIDYLGGSGLEVRSVTDGHVLATLPGGYTWYQIAADGSYVCGGSATALTAWSPTGTQLFSQTGNYPSGTNVFASATQIQYAAGPAGQTVVQSFAIPAGIASVSTAFMGQFASWFVDGAHFSTTQGNAVYIYSNTVVQQDLAQLTGNIAVSGVGNFVWAYGSGNLYQIGSLSSTPVMALGGALFPAGTTLAEVGPVAGHLSIIDLSGATPVVTNFTEPASVAVAIMAPIPGGTWVGGYGAGVIVDGATVAATPPRYLTLGAVSAIASGSSFYSIATASGQILTYYVPTNALVGTINFAAASLAASQSGSVIAAMSNPAGTRTINVYSVPGGNVLGTFNYSTPSQQYLYVQHAPPLSLSSAGDVLVAPIANTAGCYVEVIPVATGAPLYCATSEVESAHLSPDGTLLSVTPAAELASPPPTTTYLYNIPAGTLAAPLPGDGVGWLDNGRFFVNNLSSTNGVPLYVSSTIYDPTGKSLGTVTTVNWFTTLAPVSANTVYASDVNQMFSVTTGNMVWASGDQITGALLGAVAGEYVAFPSGAYVLLQPYPAGL